MVEGQLGGGSPTRWPLEKVSGGVSGADESDGWGSGCPLGSVISWVGFWLG